MAFFCFKRVSNIYAAAFLWFFLFIALFATISVVQAQGVLNHGETRSLKIYFVHTNEREEVFFKKNGRYIRSGLRRLDYLMRDWRRNEATNMDPRLFDLVWQIYQLSGSKDYIHVVSGYRSPQTNTMLRLSSPTSGVAKHSRHMEGKAMDFYLPDVNLAYLRAIALKLQGGGIGYYPASNSPFVHVDVGNVRHWPRMSHSALATLFPDGKSLHVPSDGHPLPEYALALAEYRQRGAAPLNVFSARRLFTGLSARQVILAAADGHLPRGQNMGLGGLYSQPSPLNPQPALPQPEQNSPLLSGVGDFIPIPSPTPNLAAEQSESAGDEADIMNAPVPVPQFKRDIFAAADAKKAVAERQDKIGELLAFSELPSANSAALQALNDFTPIPVLKPLAKTAVAFHNSGIKEKDYGGTAEIDMINVGAIEKNEADTRVAVPVPKPKKTGLLFAQNKVFITAHLPIPRFKGKN